jgi:hypothetical protein
MDDGWREDPLLAIIGSRQYEQWQNLRHLDPSSTEVALRVEKLCENISKALRQPWLSPLERQEAEARRVAEDERRRQEQLQEEVRQRTEEQRRRQEAETTRRLAEAETEKRRQDKERRKLEKEAAWAATKEQWLRRSRGTAAAFAAAVVLLLVGGIWLYRTTIPAGVTSAVVQPEKQTAENAKAQPKEETISAGVQSDKPNAGNAKAQPKEETISAGVQSDKPNAGNAAAETQLTLAWPAKPVRIVVPFPPGAATDQRFASFIRADTEKWTRLAKQAGIHAD